MSLLPVIKEGDSGAIVRALQASIGADPDGRAGPKTVDKIKAFQRERGLDVDGVAGAATLAAAGVAFGGVDLSHWQTEVDPCQVGRAARFVYLKAAHGVGGVDKRWHARRRAFNDAGIPVGGYHFVVPNRDDPIAAAKHMARTIGTLGDFELAPALDLEDYAKGMTPAQVCEWAHKCLTALRDTFGRAPVLYTGAAFLRYQMGYGKTRPDLAEFPLWIARYRAGAVDPGDTGVWPSWLIWQWTSAGRVAGVAGNVDCNVLLGKVADLQARRL
jgi:lysozyme